MATWTHIGSRDQFPTGSVTPVSVNGLPLVICNADGQLAALVNRCPHAGQPLADGELRGRSLTCPYHGYTYDVTTGRNVDFPYEELPAKTYPVRVTTTDHVEVDLTTADKAPSHD